MIRKIIHIDEEKCNGCGLCANACHEGAIGMVEGDVYKRQVLNTGDIEKTDGCEKAAALAEKF